MFWISTLSPFNIVMHSLYIVIGTCSIICGITTLLLIYCMVKIRHNTNKSQQTKLSEKESPSDSDKINMSQTSQSSFSVANIFKANNLRLLFKNDTNSANIKYIVLIVNLASCQLLFDMCCFLTLCNPHSDSDSVCNPDIFFFLIYYMGAAVTLWTNVIGTALLIELRSKAKMKNYFIQIFSIIHSYGCLNGILIIIALQINKNGGGIMGDVINICYYSLRLLSILYNIIIVYLIYRERPIGVANDQTKRTSRLVYYPIVQIITFIPSFWFELHFGVSRDDDLNTTSNRGSYEISWIFNAIFLFSAGIGFSIVFFMVEPNAFQTLIKITKRIFGYKVILSPEESQEISEIRDYSFQLDNPLDYSFRPSSDSFQSNRPTEIQSISKSSKIQETIQSELHKDKSEDI